MSFAKKGIFTTSTRYRENDGSVNQGLGMDIEVQSVGFVMSEQLHKSYVIQALRTAADGLESSV